MRKYINPKYNWSDFHNLNPIQIETKAKEILDQMTLEEKLKQMVGAYKPITGFLKLLRMARKGLSIPFEGSYNDRLGIPPILFSDGPRGIIMQKKGVPKPTCFPVSMARGATFDPELEERIGEAMGIELRAFGGNIYGGVCINQLYHPRGGRAQETYGEDSYLLGEMGSALVRGVQKHGVMACSKHYAANNQEDTRFKIDVKLDERTLREVFLPHFKKTVEAGVASFMAAYNSVNGVKCAHHSHLLREILKGEWNFDGFVVSDWTFAVKDGKQAILGGLDVEMPWEWRMNTKKIKTLVDKGEIPIEYVNDTVLRILRQKIRFNQKENPELYRREKVGSREHVFLALEAARKSIVLLENNEDFLPLQKEKINRIGVFGKYANKPNTGDRGSSRVKPNYVITPFEGIKMFAGNTIHVIYYDGFDLKITSELASSVDIIVLVVGFDYKDEGENKGSRGGDREFLHLKMHDIQLIQELSKVNPNAIVIMQGGASVTTESWREKVKAILMQWYPGMEGGTALGEVLFGDVNPSGKCPCTFPISEDQLPPFNQKALNTTYGYYHGYTYIDKYNHMPRYPFGFGLSYTAFEYSNLKVDRSNLKIEDKLEFSIEIANVGKISGEEVVQVYVGYQNSEVERHVKDLKRFKRVSLKPKEKKIIKFMITTKELAYYSVTKASWIIESVECILYVGPSSRSKDLLEIPFRITSS